MTLQLEDIKTIPEYENLVSPLTGEEYNSLKSSITEHGLLLPIMINSDGIILDGHHRHKACNDLNIVPKYKIKKFDSKLDEIIFVGECNLTRRTLEPLQRISLVKKLKPYYEEKARQNQGTRTDTSVKHFTQVGRVNELLAKKANVSHTQYGKGEVILDCGDKSLIADVLKNKTSINAAHKDIKKQAKKKQRQDEIKKVQTNLPNTIQLFNGDFKDNKILKNTVSLIFTDPDYTNYNIQVYSDLAKQAMEVLKENGSVLCYTGHYILREVMNAMVEQGLKFHWLIPVLHSGPSSLMFSKKILVGYKPLLWFTKGKYDGDHVKDVIKSEFQGKELHEWAQSTVESDYYIKHMTEENEIVYDPFMGQGTFGISAAKLKRQFIGSDINPEHYNTAKKLLTLALKEKNEIA